MSGPHLVISADSLKRQPGALISLGPSLYEVVKWESSGASSGKMAVINCRNERETWLRASEVVEAKLVRRAPPTIEDKPASRADDPRGTQNYGLGDQPANRKP